jgi:hypothetical protein
VVEDESTRDDRSSTPGDLPRDIATVLAIVWGKQDAAIHNKTYVPNRADSQSLCFKQSRQKHCEGEQDCLENNEPVPNSHGQKFRRYF